MPTSKSINSTTYQIPLVGESGWGAEVTNFLIAVADNGLFTGGGTRTLTSELDLGADFGIKSIYFLTSTANAASAGVLRLSNNEGIQWRNAANDGNVALLLNASDRLTLDSINIPTISSTDTFTNKSIDADNNTITNLANANIKAGAAIDATKIGDGSVSNTRFGYLSGVSSDIQTQLDAKFNSSDVVDEDDMLSNSNTKVPTQQSTKAYVDTQIASISASGAEYLAQSSDYTITDVDNVRVLGVTTGASDRTITLPTAADNEDRIITIKKIDSGVGVVIIDGEGSETIDGSTTLDLEVENDSVTLVCTGLAWESLSQQKAVDSEVVLHTGNGFGSTNTQIRRFTTLTEEGTAFTVAQSSTDGDSVTVNRDCIVAIQYSDSNASGSSGVWVGLSKNADANLTTAIQSLTPAQGRIGIGFSAGSSQAPNEVSATVRCSSGDILRCHGSSASSYTSLNRAYVRFTEITRL